MGEPKSRLESMLTTIQVLSVVAGVVISVLSWHTTQQAEANARNSEAQQYSDQRKDTLRAQKAEAAKPFLELRQKLYLQALQTAGVLANPEVHSPPEVTSAKKRFRELYVAELSMVEAPEVEGQMAMLAQSIDPELTKMTPAQITAFNLAHAVRNSLANSWGVDESIVSNATGTQ